MKQWWEFSMFDIAGTAAVLIALYALLGPPDGLLGWLIIAPGLLVGRYIAHRTRRR